MDNCSDYANTTGWGDEVMRVFEDPSPGAKAQVILQPGYVGYHGNTMGDHGDGEYMAVLGTLSLAPEVSWVTMDGKICEIFMHHINSIDLDRYLGLGEDSIMNYFIGDQCRQIGMCVNVCTCADVRSFSFQSAYPCCVHPTFPLPSSILTGNALLPPLTPYQALGVRNSIRIVMRGAAQDSCDSLAYKTLMNCGTLQSYMAMLRETQWVVVMGTKGTCKTSLAAGLARHLALCVSGDDEGQVISFNMDKFGMEVQ